jgi:hypothetical protein
MVGAHALDQCPLDLGIAPASDSGLLMFGAVATKAGVSNVSPPENALSAIILPVASRGEWQLPQAMMVLTR